MSDLIQRLRQYVASQEDSGEQDIAWDAIAALESQLAAHAAFRVEAGRVADDYLATLSAMHAWKERAEKAEARIAECEGQEPVDYQYLHPSISGFHWRHFQYWNGHSAKESRPLYALPLLLREPTDEECERISKVATISMAPQTTFAGIGRAMHRAVVEVMGRRK